MKKPNRNSSIEEINNYLSVDYKTGPSDIGFLFGVFHKNDLASKHTGTLYCNGMCKKILITGGITHETDGIPESVIIKKKLLKMNIPENNIYTEENSKHGYEIGSMNGTYWNVKYSIPIIESIKCDSVLLICEWFHAKRAIMTFESLVHDKKIFLSTYGCGNVDMNNWHQSEIYKNLIFKELDLLNRDFDGENVKVEAKG